MSSENIVTGQQPAITSPKISQEEEIARRLAYQRYMKQEKDGPDFLLENDFYQKVILPATKDKDLNERLLALKDLFPTDSEMEEQDKKKPVRRLRRTITDDDDRAAGGGSISSNTPRVEEKNDKAGKLTKTKSDPVKIDFRRVAQKLKSAGSDSAPIDTGDTMIKCPCCSERLILPSITRHFDTHFWVAAVMSVVDDDDSIACPFCGFAADSDEEDDLRTILFTHLVLEHCEFDGKQQVNELRRLEDRYDGFVPIASGTKDSCKCPICGKSYSKRYDFSHHIEEAHEFEASILADCFRRSNFIACPFRKMECAIGDCSSKFSSESTMKKHLKDVHHKQLALLENKKKKSGLSRFIDDEAEEEK